MTQTVDLGNGWTAKFFTEHEKTEPTGMILCGPASPVCKHRGRSAGADGETRCCGGVNFTNSEIAQKEGRPMWTVQLLDPLEISPSVRCGCDLDHPGQGQHGWVRGGKYVGC